MPANPPPPPPGSSSSAPAGSNYFPLPFHLQQHQPQPQMPPPMAASSYQQYQQQLHQAHQLFQRDAQTITPEALQSVKAALATRTSSTRRPAPAPGPLIPPPTRSPSPAAQPDNPGKTPPSPTGPKVVRDKRTGKTKGYGFVSFSNPTDLAAAIKEMNGKYVGNRPIKLRKSNWKERTDVEALERQKNHVQRKPKVPKKSILHK
ncbi:hypothetical protein C2845_PM04G31640 [Panicum miliaceum]|uniref:RRM domain-containing protein n=1 Tax=Panicum miliaceum TaxID=4540 RepID=A0A3L6QV13_PANMI|nr:hypothetical protein C2845_PM04G31640 [Panicum miliaceum]